MLAVEDLKKSLPHFVLDIPKLVLEKGETFVLLGPTGAGKSSFLELLAGFQQADQGRILVNGSDVSKLPPDQRQISIIFQQAHLFPHLDVRENIRYGDADSVLFDQVVQLLALQDLLSKKVGVLSGGERQLVAVARALMVRPQILLLDEPFNAIDPHNRKSVIEAFRRAQREVQMTSLAVTHNFEEGLYLAHRLGVLMRGKLIQTGTPQEVFLKPATPEVARFLGAENLYAGCFELTPDSSHARADLGSKTDSEKSHYPALFRTDSATLHVLADHEGPGYALVQPQDITLSLEPIRSSALNRFRGRIKNITTRGSVVQLQINAGLIFKVFITPQSLRDMELNRGSEVYLTFKASSVKTY